jgi:hypothetical protein
MSIKMWIACFVLNLVCSTGSAANKLDSSSTWFLLPATEPGQLIVLEDSQITGRMLGAVDGVNLRLLNANGFDEVIFTVTANQVIDILQHWSRTQCFIRFKQQVVLANYCPTLLPNKFYQFIEVQIPHD